MAQGSFSVPACLFFPGRFKRNYVEQGKASVPFLGGANITQLLVNTDKYLRNDDPRLPALRVEAGWVLITRSGSTGIVAMVPPAWDGYAISEHVIRIVPDASLLPGEYLYAFLKTKLAQESLSRGVFGSVIDEITPEFVGEIGVPIPKSKRRLNKVVGLVRAGEEAKQAAIESLGAAVVGLETLFGK